MQIENHKEEVPFAHYCERFAALDPQEAAARTGTPFADGAFCLTLLGHPYRITHPEFSISGEGGTALKSLPAQTFLMRWLLEGKQTAGSRDFLTFREMPWGELYIQPFTGRVLQRAAFSFGTRLEAFRERLGLTAPDGRAGNQPPAAEKAARKKYFAGIDSGSTTTNMVVLDENEALLAFAIVRTGPRAHVGAQAALETVCRTLHIEPDALSAIVATGYGRNNIPFATRTKTEITCHARGAHALNPAVRTIIDIGGQDSKVINLDETGHVSGFMMNDKCAAGTGRFLEMMARTLELDMEEMSRRGLTWEKELTISSMCTVFAESEVISLIADNHTDSDIIHGLNQSIAGKTAAMAARAKGQPPYMMTGGVARNRGVVQALEEKLGAKLFISENPDLCGALGAALFALHGD